MISHRELQEIKERAEKATPGPWVWDDCRVDWQDAIVSIDEHEGKTQIIKTDSHIYPPEPNDANFIMASRTDIPKLISLLEEAVEVIRFYENEEIYENKEVTVKAPATTWSYTTTIANEDGGVKAREFLKRYEK